MPKPDSDGVNRNALLHAACRHRFCGTGEARRPRRVPAPIDSASVSVYDIRLVLEELSEPYRTTVLLAACLGLRASEIIGLQWGDFSLEDLTLLVRAKRGSRAESEKRRQKLPGFLPVNPRLAEALKEHWRGSLHRGLSDWVFANRAGKPRWQESILQRQIKPKAVRAGHRQDGWI